MRILFFGRLRDAAGTNEIATSERFASLSDLRRWLTREHAELAQSLDAAGVRVAVDGQIIHGRDSDLRTAKEIAFMPPMSGG